MNTLKPTLLATVALGLLACVNTTGEFVESPQSEPGTLTLTIGLDGAEFVGEPFTVFEGVKLSVPAGAVDEPTDVTLRVILDPAPLPEGAFGVGRQFTFDPPLVLKAPAQATLPVYTEAVAAHGVDLIGVRVWLKGPLADKWVLVHPDQTGSHTTTLTLNELGTVAAGVKITELAGAEMPCLQDGSCAAASDWNTVAHDGPAPGLSRLAAQGNHAFYLARSAQGLNEEVTAVRVDLATGETTVSAPALVLAGDVQRDRGIAIDADGNVWVGARLGALRLSFTGDSALHGGGSQGTAIAQTPNGIRWYRVNGNQLEMQHFSTLSTLSAPVVVNLAINDVALPSVGLRLTAAGRFVVLANVVAEVDDDGAAVSTRSLPAGGMALGAPGRAQAAAAVVNATSSVMHWAQPGQAELQDATALGRVSQLASADDGVWAALIDLPAVAHIAPEGAVMVYTLSDDPQALSQVAGAIAVTGAGAPIVLNLAGELLIKTD